jgi:hypothetical protein
MNIQAVCREVRAVPVGAGSMMEVVAGVEPAAEPLAPLAALTDEVLAGVRKKLREPGRPAARPSEGAPASVRVLIRRDDGHEAVLQARVVEMLDLSVGSRLYWLHAEGDADEWRWLVGLQITLVPQPEAAELQPARSA